MKKTFLSLAAATLLGLTFSACQIDITPTTDTNSTKKVNTSKLDVATNKYDGYTQEQLQNLGEVQSIAPITDLIGHTFYTLDLSDTMYGDAYYNVLTFNHLDSPDGVVEKDYSLENGEWVKDIYSVDGSNEIYEIQGDKLHVTGQDCYDYGDNQNAVCEDYEEDIYIIDKQADEWILQISYSSNGNTEMMIQSFYINEPAEVQDPSLITLGSNNYDYYNQDYNYNDYYQEADYNNDTAETFDTPDYSTYVNTDLLALRYSYKLQLDGNYGLSATEKTYYENELERIQAEIDSRNSSAASARVQRTLHRVHKLFR